MRSKIALPLVLLFASACAQLPDAPQVGAFDEPQPVSRSEKGSSPVIAEPASQPVAVPQAPIAQAAAPSTATNALVAVTPPAARPARSRTAGKWSRPDATTAEQAATTGITAGAASSVEPEAPSKSLWPRITRGFSMAPLDSELVRDWENWYANRPDYVARMIDRSSHFLFHIVEQVERRGMPMEIALLPMIESAYNPVAYSRAHASGIWQFIPSTGKHFGLRQNWWYDGRRDVIAATDAALDYLEKLYGMFGDWQLALASYNWGEGAVSRAMERNRAKGLPTDYESLTVPTETRGYIPKLVAVKNIILNPARYGLQIAEIPNEPYFEVVKLKRHIDVKLAAKLAELPLDEFKFLNPGHHKPVIRAGEAERIVLPKHNAQIFAANFEKHDKPLVTWEAVTLRRGEKAERVAAQHGMTLAELKQINGLQNQKKLVVGQPLLVPLKEAAAEPQLPDLPATPISLPKAVQAAKTAAHAKTVEAKTAIAAKAGVRKAAQKGAVQKHVAQKANEKVVVQKGRKTPVQQLRAEHGKHVKVVAGAKPAAAKKSAGHQPRVKVAASK
jgi:membrane-bound lytic murein transglycosylase D